MGQYLSQPVVHKHTDSGKGFGLEYGISSHQGWRKHMEDAHVVHLSEDVTIVGVFDGHGGAEVARFVARHLPNELQQTPAFQERNYSQSLIDAFHRMDELLPHSIDELEQLRQPEEETADEDSENTFDVLRKLLVLQRMAGSNEQQLADESAQQTSSDSQDENMTDEDTLAAAAGPTAAAKRAKNKSNTVNAGCTAVVALLAGNELYIANAGDSRAVLCRNGKALALSSDHKPGHPSERERIIAAGGFLSDWGGICRVNGNLSLSRAIGDLRYKMNEDLHPRDQIITAEPDVQKVDIVAEDSFLVLACDGIWDVKENQEVVDFVKEGLAAGKAPTDIASELLDACLANDPRETRGAGGDNMTASILILNSGNTQLEGEGKK